MVRSVAVPLASAFWGILVSQVFMLSQSFPVSPSAGASHRPSLSVRQRHPWQRTAALDPAEVTNAIAGMQHHLPSSAEHPHALEALLNTMYSAAVDLPRPRPVDLTPAHGHSNPLFGPPDPYLQAGRSIPPPPEALLEMGVAPASRTAPEGAPAAVREAVAAGTLRVLDAAALRSGPPPNAAPATAVQLRAALGWLRLLEVLPNVAVAYALLEFFWLRAGEDRYQEDLEAAPTQVAVEWLWAAARRFGVVLVLSSLAVAWFL